MKVTEPYEGSVLGQGKCRGKQRRVSKTRSRGFMTPPSDKTPVLRDFAPSILVLAITSITLALVTQMMLAQEQRFYMYMMFAGIVCALFDLSIAWLVFGGGSYWIRLPLIAVLTSFICWLLSRTFPQGVAFWLGMLLVRVPCIGLPLLVSRFRGSRLVHRSDPPNRKRGSLQFSLASLLTLFTTAAIFLVAGRFAEFSQDELFFLMIFALSAIATLAAWFAAWSPQRFSFRMIEIILATLIIAVVQGRVFRFGLDVITMMLATLVVTV